MKKLIDSEKDIKAQHLEKTFLVSFLVAALVSDLFVLLFEVFVTKNLAFLLIDAVIVIFLVSLLFFIDRISVQKSAAILVFTLSTSLVLQAIYLPGWSVDILTTALIAVGVFTSLMLQGNWKKVLLSYIFCLMLILWYKEVQESKAIGLDILQQAMPYFLIYWVSVIPSGLLKERYVVQQQQLRLANEEVYEKNEEITVQHQALLASHDAVSKLNKHLEEMVAIKSGDIIEQNKRLQEYAFTHAHIVRGHTARLAGLFKLIEIDGPSKEFYWEKIQEEVGKMERTIQELGDELYKDVQEKEGENAGNRFTS